MLFVFVLLVLLFKLLRQRQPVVVINARSKNSCVDVTVPLEYSKNSNAANTTVFVFIKPPFDKIS